MTSPTLKALMTERSWEQDWPSQSPEGRPGLPDTWKEGLLASTITTAHFDDLKAVAALLKGEPGAPTVRQLRQALANFEQWNTWAEDHLTFPPSLEAFGAALVAGLTEKSSQTRELTQAVAYCYPELSWAALCANPAFQAKLPTDMAHRWWPTPVVAEPVAPVVNPLPASPNRPSSGAMPAPSAARPARREEPNQSPPHRSYDIEAKWPRETLLPLVRAHKDNPSALVSQELDAALRQHYNATRPKPWVEEVLLPSLMSLKASELQELMAYWPSAARYEVKSPVELVNQPKFWAQLRDAEPDAQRQLIRHVLPLVVQSDTWSTEDRLRMLRHMLNFTRSKLELFEQRLELWQKWGGNLNEPGVLNKDRQAANNDDPFGTSTAAKSALDWIREQNQPVWNQWLARHDQEVTPPSTPETPSEGASRRRHRPH